MELCRLPLGLVASKLILDTALIVINNGVVTSAIELCKSVEVTEFVVLKSPSASPLLVVSFSVASVLDIEYIVLSIDCSTLSTVDE